MKDFHLRYFEVSERDSEVIIEYLKSQHIKYSYTDRPTQFLEHAKALDILYNKYELVDEQERHIIPTEEVIDLVEGCFYDLDYIDEDCLIDTAKDAIRDNHLELQPRFF